MKAARTITLPCGELGQPDLTLHVVPLEGSYIVWLGVLGPSPQSLGCLTKELVYAMPCRGSVSDDVGGHRPVELDPRHRRKGRRHLCFARPTGTARQRWDSDLVSSR